jgi:hypothetical protein
MSKLLQSVLLILVLSASSSALAQWRSDSVTNTLVCKAVNVQQNPKVCSDGANGVIIVWEDYRYGDGWDLFAQRLDANGVKMWPDSGVRVVRASNLQINPQIVSDDSGGAYIIWEDSRSATLSYDIFGQRIKADGAPAFELNGIMIGSATRDQRYPSLCRDGNGGAYAAWEDSRTTTTTSRPDIYMNRLTRSGVAWGSGGRSIITQGNQQKTPKIIEDGQGGCLLTYQSSFNVPLSIWGTRVNANGQSLWGATGAVIYRGASSAMIARNVHLARDGNEFLVTWEVTSASASGQDVYAQRLMMDSTKKWFSAAEVSGEWPGDQTNPRIMTDDSGGAIVVFEDFTSDAAPNYYNKDVSAVRVMDNGVDKIPAAGTGFLFVARQTRGQSAPRIAKLDDGFIAVWNDARQSATDTAVYAQRVTKAMKRQWPVANTNSTWGVPISVSASPDIHSKQVAIVERTNGAIAVFADNRAGTFDIYAQLIFRDASLPIELASFDVKANEHGDVMIDWKTANELENAGFEVERRMLGQGADNRFQVISSYNENASLRGNGNSSTPKFYSYVDQPAAGIYEYRIADIGLDGTRTPHAPKRVEVGGNHSANWLVGNAYPNPVASSLQIPVTLVEAGEITVTIKNLLGQPVYSSASSLSAGARVLDVTLPELSNGSYIYQLTAASNGQTLWVSPANTITIQR